MKLEKVVTRPRYGLYIFLFVLGIVIAGVMATTYNVEVIVNYLRNNVQGLPWPKIILGSLGFVGIIVSLILFFDRMIREMKISQFHADFLDRISHELRTPLSTMTLVSDLLKSRYDELTVPERERLWKSHHTELNRIRTDVESLLQAARLRESRYQVNFITIDLDRYLEDKWASFQAILGPEAVLTKSVEAEATLIRVDPKLFELILRNLLDNAKKFSIGKPVVEMRVRRLRRRFELTVTDHGQGFSPTAQGRLFKRFSRIEAESTEYRQYAIPGTGLGLYLSASASRAMGMTLSGESRGEGMGAMFKLIGELAS